MSWCCCCYRDKIDPSCIGNCRLMGRSIMFPATGLTGSTNGHFGVSSHGGEVKWRRNAD